MNIQLTQHAEEQLISRGLDRQQVIAVAQSPEQTLYPENLPSIAQSRIVEGDKIYLLRVIFRDNDETRLIITAYRTSNVKKYWQENT